MLILRCATDTVCWVFQATGVSSKVARCLSDQFTILYDASPSADWVRVIKAIEVHTVQLAGTIGGVYWVGL